MRRLFWMVVVAVALCREVLAQMPEPFQFGGGPLTHSSMGLPSITLEDQDRFSLMTAFDWHTPTEYLPPFSPVEPQRKSAARADQTDVSPEIAELSRPNPIYVGGEIGFMYGRSTGKYGYEYEQGYIIGEIGTDKFHLTIGMSRERINGHAGR